MISIMMNSIRDNNLILEINSLNNEPMIKAGDYRKDIKSLREELKYILIPADIAQIIEEHLTILESSI